MSGKGGNWRPMHTTTMILIGNPGVGKSTLLNCLLGKDAGFKSGVSFGGGLTQVLQMYTAPDGNRYADTPGLSDAVMREKAALEIENGLKQGGTFKIFFVVVLESGRVRPEDVTTIKLVLDGAPQIKSNYSIIINKIPKPTHQKLTQNENDRMQVVTLLNISHNSGTFKVYCNVKREELEDVNDCVISLDPQLIQFINEAPQVIISPERVEHIKANEFEKLHEELSAELTALKNDNKKLSEMVAAQTVQMVQLEQQHRKERKEMEEQRQRERKELEEERRREKREDAEERKREKREHELELKRGQEEMRALQENQKRDQEEMLKLLTIKEEEKESKRATKIAAPASNNEEERAPPARKRERDDEEEPNVHEIKRLHGAPNNTAAAIGSAVGALVGACIPPIGAAVGAVVGGAIGTLFTKDNTHA